MSFNPATSVFSGALVALVVLVSGCAAELSDGNAMSPGCPEIKEDEMGFIMCANARIIPGLVPSARPTFGASFIDAQAVSLFDL